jgi:hypothetical protein
MPPIVHNRDLRGDSFLAGEPLSKTQPGQPVKVRFGDFLGTYALILAWRGRMVDVYRIHAI